jgi:hypothetical protein
MTDLEDFDFEECYTMILEHNIANDAATGEIATMHIAILTYQCEKFAKGINITFSEDDNDKVVGILKEMGLRNI